MKKLDKEEFPHEGFPYRLEDKRENKTCFFQSEDHMNKYIARYKLNTKQYKISVNGQPNYVSTGTTASKKPRKSAKKQ